MVYINLEEIFSVILGFLGSILLIALIVLTIKLIKTVNKLNNVIDDVENKTQKLNGLFNIVDATTDALSNISDKVVDFIVNGILGIFNKKNKREELEDE